MMETYEQFVKRMDDLDKMMWCAEMADNFLTVIREQARITQTRKALIATVNPEWVARWHAEKGE